MRSRVFIGAVGAAMFALAGSTAVLSGGRPLAAQMTGAAEVPGPGDPDATGHARITLNQGRGEVCWHLSWENIDGEVTAAHIHVGAADVAGPIVVPLSVVPDSTGSSSGCTDADRGLIKDIRQNSDNYYVNVHSTEFPPGAIRGQLGWPG